MQFKIGDKVKYIDSRKKSWGDNGTVERKCGCSSTCVIVRFTNGKTHHIYTGNLELKAVKNQQLLFNFMQD